MPQHKTTLPRAGPMPVFQTALKDSRFGFSATDRSSNLTQNVSNQGQRLQVMRFNPTHSNIDDNGNNVEDSSSSDEDSSSRDKDSDEDNNNNNNGDDNNDDNNNDDDNYDDKSNENGNDNDIYQGDENGGDMGKWLPKSL